MIHTQHKYHVQSACDGRVLCVTIIKQYHRIPTYPSIPFTSQRSAPVEFVELRRMLFGLQFDGNFHDMHVLWLIARTRQHVGHFHGVVVVGVGSSSSLRIVAATKLVCGTHGGLLKS